MEPHLRIDSLPGCRGDCQQGQRPCLSPEECAPDSPPLTRSGCLLVVAAAVLGWAAAGALIWIAMGLA